MYPRLPLVLKQDMHGDETLGLAELREGLIIRGENVQPERCRVTHNAEKFL